MARRSYLMLFLIAVVLAVLTTMVVVKSLRQWQTQTIHEPTKQIVVVQKQLSTHQVVDSSDVKLESVPARGLPVDVVTNLNQAVGAYTATDWFPGQQLVSGMLVQKSVPQSFPLQIPSGERAFTIANDGVSGVDHLISPGDQVDVVVSYSDNNNMKVVKTLLQDVTVLNVDIGPTDATASSTSANAGSGSAKTGSQSTSVGMDTLTLAVTPQQAQELDFGMTYGRLHISLRNPKDSSTDTLSKVTMSDWMK